MEHVFDWRPSKASALLVAAARGTLGVCGTRDSARPITLTAASPHVHRLPLAHALKINPLARAVAGITDLAEAERASERACGFSATARERDRAARLGPPATPAATVDDRPIAPQALAERYAQWERRTVRNGIAYVTMRRIVEELDL
ncbi:DUF1152 domain-containing protein [Streptomyces sp. NPDC101194]|uniref:DUF1152 domain-containing protein n=1 Tax=Streptomyces sp. NPDC101194 TaxID=3366127 RepID=UPI003811B2B2